MSLNHCTQMKSKSILTDGHTPTQRFVGKWSWKAKGVCKRKTLLYGHYWFFQPSYSIADELDCAKQNSNNSLILVPNPNNGVLFLLNTSDEDIINTKITITNINGQEVYQEYNIDLLRNQRKYFNLSKLDNYMYIIKVASSNFFEQIKMIIIK